jgi:hypothetical protein
MTTPIKSCWQLAQQFGATFTSPLIRIDGAYQPLFAPSLSVLTEEGHIVPQHILDVEHLD